MQDEDIISGTLVNTNSLSDAKIDGLYSINIRVNDVVSVFIVIKGTSNNCLKIRQWSQREGVGKRYRISLTSTRSTEMKLRRKQPGFFDIEKRVKKLTQMGDPLIALNAQVDREAFRADLNRVHHGVGVDGGERKSNAGAKPIDVVLEFKILVLQ